MDHTTKRPLRGFVLLGAVSLAVVAGAAVWLQAGWRSLGLQLTDRIGDGAQELQGFTLEGALQWRENFDALCFRLQDGALQTEYQLDRPQAAESTLRYASRLVPTLNGHGKVDTEAFVSSDVSPGFQILRAYTSALQRTYTFTLPDQTTLRLTGEKIALPGEVSVTAWTGDVGELDAAYDYAWDGDTGDAGDDPALEEPLPPATADVIPLGGGYGLCWRQDALGCAPGLYRAGGLTDEEIAALPRNGTVQGRRVLCAATEFGTLTPFYCPENAVAMLGAAAMEEGRTLLFYQDTDNILCAELVTADGRQAARRELGRLPEADCYLGTLLPGSRAGDVVCAVSCREEREDGRYWENGTALAAVRTQGGQITQGALLPGFSPAPDAAVLDESGGRLLTAEVLSNTYSYEAGGFGQTVSTDLSDHLELAVYDLATGRMTYQGMLHTGTEAAWDPGAAHLPRTYFVFDDALQGEGAV